ncbi:MAG: hypothetical protein ABIB04_03680 [Patescibacteria group bacterium]
MAVSQILGNPSRDGEMVLYVPPRARLFVTGQIHTSCRKFVDATETSDGNVMLFFVRHCIVRVRGLTANLLTTRTILFATEDRRFDEERPRLELSLKPMVWPKLRAAMRYMGEPEIILPEGFRHVLFYSDQLAVFEERSDLQDQGWLVYREQVPEILGCLPEDHYSRSSRSSTVRNSRQRSAA